MTAPWLPLRDDLVGEVPYGAPQLDVPIRLNVNENPYPPSAALVEAVGRAAAAAAAGLNRYPDREAWDLRADLATYLELDTGVRLDATRVWAANGSNEVMHHLFSAFGGPGRVALGFAPTYSMYPDYARDTFTSYVTEPRRDDFGIDDDAAVDAVHRHRPTLVLLASPNNPTGTALPPATITRLLEATEDVRSLVVVDEAYAEFRRPGMSSALSQLADNPRLVVTRTMSKAFGLAGARLGYCAAAPQVVDALRLVRLPYHLSAVTQAVARVALAHTDELRDQIALLRGERDALVVWLRDQGLRVADSDANFVLFGRFPDRHGVWQSMLDRGVLIRETGPDGWLRVSVGSPAENEAFRDALVAVMKGERHEREE